VQTEKKNAFSMLPNGAHLKVHVKQSSAISAACPKVHISKLQVKGTIVSILVIVFFSVFSSQVATKLSVLIVPP
jgi:hypothetical protein